MRHALVEVNRRLDLLSGGAFLVTCADAAAERFLVSLHNTERATGVISKPPMAGSFLDRWGGFVSVAAAVALGFIIASVPTPLYPLYQAEWQLPPSAPRRRCA